jgi:hypothetical protein
MTLKIWTLIISSLGVSTPVMMNSKLENSGVETMNVAGPSSGPETTVEGDDVIDYYNNLLNWRNSLEGFHPGLIPIKKILLHRI